MHGLRGLLISAVMDFTVLMATCLALRPALIAVSESEDRDLSDGVDRPRFRLLMVEMVISFGVYTIYIHALFCTV
jgi:hypothetical protein